MSVRITVTGGAGFIGSHLVDALLASGHEVLTVDDLSGGRANFLEQALRNPAHTLMPGDVRDRRLIRRCLEHSDLVYHLAAVLGVRRCVEDPLKVMETNMDGTRVVVEEAFRSGVKVVFASTSEVYGKNRSVPFREDSDRVLGSTRVNRWSYATAKALDEHLCLAYSQKGLPVTVIRYFNAYGPRATATAYGGVIPAFIRAALKGDPLTVHGTGRQRRCFTYIDDIVKGTVLAADPKANGLVLNLGSRNESTIHSLARRIRRLTNSASPIVKVAYSQAYGDGYEDMPRRVPALERAGEVLGYRPSVGLEKGLLKTIEWFRISEPLHPN